MAGSSGGFGGEYLTPESIDLGVERCKSNLEFLVMLPLVNLSVVLVLSKSPPHPAEQQQL